MTNFILINLIALDKIVINKIKYLLYANNIVIQNCIVSNYENRFFFLDKETI